MIEHVPSEETVPQPKMWMMSKPTHGTRRAPRYYLGGGVELTNVDSGQMKVALVRALSLYGCLVKTEMPVKEAAKVALKIVHSGTHFSALGRVVGCVGDKTSRGMLLGVTFLESPHNLGGAEPES